MLKELITFSAKYLAASSVLILAMTLGMACTPASSDGAAARQVVMIDGEELVVTRELGETPAAPVTMTPQAAGEEHATLDLGLSSPPQTLDPQRVSSPVALDLVENLFVGLTRYNSATGNVEADLATHWEVSGDGLTWTFHLRDDLFWIRPGLQSPTSILPTQSGPEPYRPVIADDVVFAVERACSRRTQVPDALVLFIIKGCEEVYALVEPGQEDLAQLGVRALDDRTVQFTLVKPAAYFSTITGLPLMRPIPREVVTAFEGSEGSWAAFPGVMTSGRFIIDTESVDESRTVLRRNPYWPLPFSGTVQDVNIYWLDSESAYEMWLDKGIDVSPLPLGMRDEFMRDTRMRSRLNLIPSQAVFYLAFNFESEVFSEPAVRRAFSAAVDRQALIDDVYDGRGWPMRHFTPPGVLGAPPIDQVGVGYSPDWARLQMAESTVRDCKFIPQIRYLVSNSDLALFHAETLRSMWVRELGCPEEQIVIEQAQFGTVLSRTQSDAGADRPDLWDLGWTSYYPDAHNWLGEILHCTESENRQNRPCTDADTLISEAATTRDPAERTALYREVEQRFFGDDGIQPITPLFAQSEFVLVHPWLVYEPAHFGGEQYDRYQLDPLTKRLERQQ
jgi:ABC-type oligopeptide transport system substrate-binding subunit